MNKLSFVEAIESNRLRKNSLLFFICLSIFIFPLNVFTQVERNFEQFSLNGFGRYIFVDYKIKLVSIAAYDFDGDGIVDIGGLDESRKNLFVYYGKGSNNFSNPVKYSFSKTFSGFLVKNLRINGKTNLVLYSTLEGLISIYSFYGRSISNSANISVDCCFSNMEAINLDNSQGFELVVYGSNFRGFGIISFNTFSNFTYKKIGEEAFSKLVPFYLNSDNKIDFVGFNPLSRELVLLRNNSLFNYSRNVFRKFDVAIDEILTGNFDDDFWNDIVLISNQSKSLFTLFGNGIGNFSNQINYNLISNYSSTLVFDYNLDLNDDFIVYDKFKKRLFLKSLTQGNLLKSLPLIELEKLYSMNVYRTTTTKGIAISSNEGLFLIVQSNLSFKVQQYAISSNPVDLQTYRVSSELYPKIIFIDRENLRLNILNRNEYNSPQDLLSAPISYKYEKIKILQANDNQLYIACYKPFIYNFDFFVINIREGKFKREIVTVDGLIRDINIEPSSSNKILLNIILQTKNELHSIVFKPFDVNKILLNEKISSLDFMDFAYDNLSRNLFKLSRDVTGKKILIERISFDQSFKKSETYELFKIKDEDYLSAGIFLCENFKNENFLYVNLKGLNKNSLFIIPIDKPSRRFVIEKIFIEDFNSCKCKEQYSRIIKNFTYYNSLSRSIERIEFIGKGKPINSQIKDKLIFSSYSIDYSLKRKAEIVYISNYSLIKIEPVDL